MTYSTESIQKQYKSTRDNKIHDLAKFCSNVELILIQSLSTVHVHRYLHAE